MRWFVKVGLASLIWIAFLFLSAPLHELVHVLLLNHWNVHIYEVQWMWTWFGSLPHVSYDWGADSVCLLLNNLWDIVLYPMIGASLLLGLLFTRRSPLSIRDVL